MLFNVNLSYISSELFSPCCCLDLQSLADYPLAVCNDGTAATYYKDDTDEESADKVLIHLNGGGSCYDADTCYQRCLVSSPNLCTASTDPVLRKTKGIWSSDPVENPPFHDYRKVNVPYCSSDLYIGNKTHQFGELGINFSGKNIIEAVVTELMPMLKTAKRVVLIGDSAGGFGTSYNCDFVADMVHARNADAEVFCVANANNFGPDWIRLEGCDLEASVKQGLVFWGGHADESCEKANPGHHEMCAIFTSYYEHVTTPFFVAVSYTDIHHGLHPCNPNYPQNPEYWDKWRFGMFQLATNFTQSEPRKGLFLVNCPAHSISSEGYMWDEISIEAEGEDMIQKYTILNWLEDNGEPYQAIDKYNVINEDCRYEGY